MSQPDVPANEPDHTPSEASIQAVVADPIRLGLIWNLRPGTVVNDDPLSVMVDGDTSSISATSMIGNRILNGARVYVLTVPPGGNFICGFADANLSSPFFVSRTTLTTTTSSISLDIPAGLADLEVSWVARGTVAALISDIRMRINGVSSGAYTTEYTQGQGAVTASQLGDSGATSAFVGYAAGATATAGIFGSGKIWFQGWDGASGRPFLNYNWVNGVMTSGGLRIGGAGLFFGAAPPYISLQLFPSSGAFASGSSFYVKGLFV